VRQIPDNKFGRFKQFLGSKLGLLRQSFEKKFGLAVWMFFYKFSWATVGVYALAILLAAAGLMFKLNEIRREKEGIAHTDLSAYPAYVRRGFDRDGITVPPDAGEAGWTRFPDNARGWRIAESGLPDLPARSLFSFSSRAPEEFTILIPFEINAAALEYIQRDYTPFPGIYLPNLGDNWEIYINGELVASEMHVRDGEILSHRVWRNIFFPFAKSLARPGQNFLALRVVGDPALNSTGMYYKAPLYINEYPLIEQRRVVFMDLLLSGIFWFMGMYFLKLFSMNVKYNKHMVYHGIFSVLMGCYSVLHSPLPQSILPDSNIILRLEYFAWFLMPPFAGAFIETLQGRAVWRPTVLYVFFCAALAFSTCFSTTSPAEAAVTVWALSLLVYGAYLAFYVLARSFKYELYEMGRRKLTLKAFLFALPTTRVGHITVSAALVALCGLFDFFDTVFFYGEIELTRYSLLVFTFSTASMLVDHMHEAAEKVLTVNSKLKKRREILERLVEERSRELERQAQIAEMSLKVKTVFLANTSHEIRTPMNAIIGMVETLLRKKLPREARENVLTVKRAWLHLLSIINDILDFSKIEAEGSEPAGSLELVTSEYFLAPFINDVVGIMRMRVTDAGIMLLVNVNAAMPRKLAGDEPRIRQALLNLLRGVIENTREGYIALTVDCSPLSGGGAQLKFDIFDSGGKLLEGRPDSPDEQDFARARKLFRLMGGDTKVFEQDVGNMYSVTIPQKVRDTAPAASVNAGGLGGVMLYDTRGTYADSVACALDNLNVFYARAEQEESFETELLKRRYAFIFVEDRLLERAWEIARKLAPQAKVVRLAGLGQTVWPSEFTEPRPEIITMDMPVYSILIADVLNGKDSLFDEPEVPAPRDSFAASGAEFLVVDDISTNLRVAANMLAMYDAHVDCCDSGRRAIEMSREKKYDIIFMDYMMPEMDGMEAMKAIRSLCGGAAVPIVALTADAQPDTKEKFLKNGFNDYLTKPIEPQRLSEIVARWTPAEKLGMQRG
jgi:CheY-like chemotaxis protein/signal transduction histidine kinase